MPILNPPSTEEEKALARLLKTRFTWPEMGKLYHMHPESIRSRLEDREKAAKRRERTKIRTKEHVAWNREARRRSKERQEERIRREYGISLSKFYDIRKMGHEPVPLPRE